MTSHNLSHITTSPRGNCLWESVGQFWMSGSGSWFLGLFHITVSVLEIESDYISLLHWVLSGLHTNWNCGRNANSLIRSQRPSWHGIFLPLHSCPFPFPSQTQRHVVSQTAAFHALVPPRAHHPSFPARHIYVDVSKSFPALWELFSYSVAWCCLHICVFPALWLLEVRNYVLFIFVLISIQ